MRNKKIRRKLYRNIEKYRKNLQLKKIKKMELITIASAGCALAYAAGACFGNSMYYTTPYFYMFLGMTARTIKLKNTK